MLSSPSKDMANGSSPESMRLVDSKSLVGSIQDSFSDRWRKRTAVLIGLLLFQSCSSFILAHFERLLQKHSVVVFFLTMLVGAGGNAGNQAAVLVIRGLATGEVRPMLLTPPDGVPPRHRSHRFVQARRYPQRHGAPHR